MIRRFTSVRGHLYGSFLNQRLQGGRNDRVASDFSCGIQDVVGTSATRGGADPAGTR